MNDGLKDIHRNAIFSIFAASDRVERAVLFGSRAMGTNTVSSDVDIALFGNELTLKDQARIAEALEEIPMAQSVDLILYDSIRDVAFKQQIKEHGIDWYQRDCHKIRSDASYIPGWNKTTIGKFCFFNYGQGLPKKDRINGAFKVFGSNGVIGYHNEALIDAGVIIGRKGTVGAVHYSSTPFWPIDTTFYIKERDHQDIRYIYYLLKCVGLDTMNTDSAVPGLNRKAAHALKIWTPPLPEQRAIAHVLGTLDDKIELNRRMNKTLEEMAQALFKSWFVDFEPVRAKMEGRDTGLPKHISDLFPDRLVESELGLIPEGWKVENLGNLAKFRLDKVDPRNVESNTPYIGLQHMPRKSIALMNWGNAGEIASQKSIFEKGDILFGKLRPYFHKVGSAPLDGISSTDIIVLQSYIPVWKPFILMCVSSSSFVAYTSQASTGTKMPRTSWGVMKKFKFCCPRPPIAAVFQDFVSPVLGCIVSHVHEIHALNVLRNTLLPKLILGEIRLTKTGNFD